MIGQGEKSSDINYFANTVHEDYIQLYRLQDSEDGDQQNVHSEFKEQLRRNEDGSYSTRLPWIRNHPELHNNSAGALARLYTLIRCFLQFTDMLNEYHDII